MNGRGRGYWLSLVIDSWSVLAAARTWVRLLLAPAVGACLLGGRLRLYRLSTMALSIPK